MARKWIEVNDLASVQYSVNKNVRFETSMFRSYLCDDSGAYIVVKGTIDLLTAAANENDKAEKDVALENNAPSRLCISRINSALIGNVEDLDIVMPMYNLLEYSQIILWHQKVYGIIIETKLMMLMITLQMGNYLNIKQK